MRDDDNAGGVLRAPGRPIVGDDEVAAALDALERSSAFRHSSQLKRLVRHLVLHAQAGEENALREIAVGVAALGRDPRTFDPKSDPIVRTEARRLRAKLAAYYAREGAAAAVIIDLPKGAYVPVVRRRIDAGAVDEASIAVLPFANFTGDPSREPFCDALTDELIDALARIDGLRVVARTSAFRFKNAHDDVREIARRLSVRMVIEGSVQSIGSRMRVLAQLVLASSGTHVWSQAFVADFGDLAAVEETLADEIARSLERAGVLSIPAGAAPVRGPRGTRDAAARDLYDRALGILRTLETARFDRARDMLVEALQRDPSFARAHHLLALDLSNRVSMCTLPAAEGLPSSRRHLQQALALDPDFAQARALLAWITGVWDRDWTGSLVQIRRAVRSAPGNFAVRNTCGNLYGLFGRFDDAEAELMVARELDPLHLIPRYNAAITAWYAGEQAIAVQRCDAILDVEPQHPAGTLRVAALIAGGDVAAALEHARTFGAAAKSNPIAAARLAEALAANGDIRAGRSILDAARPALIASGTLNYAQAHFCAVAGDEEGAWLALDAALTARESNTEAAAVNPYFAPLRADARWPAFARRHRLPGFPSRAPQ